ncbi:MAG: UDP-N-acetylmuramoyl-L-alanyl-D-glutamate--2,6-diaminopimelate ligase [Solirubrobacteraceae bacterium]|nr:UDP-N-acetylmuramoyl-L-alanyl-D-glutamate--2,6-diaminopimelate ligase [Solirubrobacteraceae bacterium]
MDLRDVMGPEAPAGVDVTSLAYDSRDVVAGTLFFCVPGFRADGHDFAPAAVQAGASALVVERPLGLGVPEVRVRSVRAAMAPAAARFHGDPTARLAVVGITGTNGKTTTAWLVRHLLASAGTPTGLLGTVASVVGGREEAVERTTPEAIDLQATFARMVDAGDRACALEVSSHALELGRADAIHWAAAVFTNLSRDHLDFHDSMEDYYLAKRRLFQARPRAAVVNADDAHGRRLAAETGAVTYAVHGDADWRALDVRGELTGSTFRVVSPAGEADVRTPLPGAFNVYNALGALAAASALGVGLEAAAAALGGFSAVPGRFEPVDEGQEFAVLVDYAHTPDSLENVLAAARELTAGRVVVVFGAGGDRDRGKRPLMGEIATRLADLAIVTSDNPRSEDPEAIVAEIVAGAGPSAETVIDRRAAIARAVEAARPGDVVVVAGKGHEQGQEFADGRKEPFDDVTVAREALRGVTTAGR